MTTLNMVDAFTDLANRIWQKPEIAGQEFFATQEHAEMLERHGARVTREIAGLPTAVLGEWGEGGPILSEYDALPDPGRCYPTHQPAQPNLNNGRGGETVLRGFVNKTPSDEGRYAGLANAEF